VPADGPGQERGFLKELLDVVLAEVGVLERRLVQGEDVGGGLELRNGYKADLECVSCSSRGKGREGRRT
jgi:hypothetical protein